MGKIIGKAKAVGKSYYLYATLYCAGIIGMLIITFYRYDVITQALNTDNWKGIVFLLGTLLSLPILALMFLQKITRTLAVLVAGITSITVMIVYWISTTGAETFVATLKTSLTPFLAIFFLYTAITSMIYVWQKIKSK